MLPHPAVAGAAPARPLSPCPLPLAGTASPGSSPSARGKPPTAGAGLGGTGSRCGLREPGSGVRPPRWAPARGLWGQGGRGSGSRPSCSYCTGYVLPPRCRPQGALLQLVFVHALIPASPGLIPTGPGESRAPQGRPPGPRRGHGHSSWLWGQTRPRSPGLALGQSHRQPGIRCEAESSLS